MGMTREEAINKLEYLINSPVGREEIDETCYEVMKYLAAQESRVMTLEELLALKENTPVYVENCDGLHGWDVFAGPDYDDGYEYVMTGAPWAAMDYWPQSEYNDTWRCWTSEPTTEQRKSVKWD